MKNKWICWKQGIRKWEQPQCIKKEKESNDLIPPMGI